jgi:hypothetical protein
MAQEPQLAQHGTSRSYILARLRREGLTEYANAVENGTISAFAIAVGEPPPDPRQRQRECGEAAAVSA